MVPIRKFSRAGAPHLRRPQRWPAPAGCTAACDAVYSGVPAGMTGPEATALTAGTGLIETPAHINRLAWAWLREFQQDLQDDCDNRLETNNR
jgi:hypothetical protein